MRPTPPDSVRRRLAAAAAALPVVALAPAARAQSGWPADRPIRLICPFPPGGNSDALARVLADRLREHLKATNVLVDNRPGGTTQVGIEAGARAEPDGHTMVLATATSFTVLPNLRRLPFDLASFEFAGGVADYIAFVTVRKGLGVKTLAEFVELARRSPGKYTWGSAGNASAGHIYGEMLKKAAGIDLLHVAYKGSADAASALVGEQVDMIIDGTGLGLARGGRAVLLATFFDQRHPEVPDVPAITETGVPVKLPAGGWGIAYPKGTPAPIVAQTGAALERILAEPPTREKLLRASVVAVWTRPDEYRRALDSGRAYYAELLQSIGMKQE
jgi:tripartite-type tricarboxylate transporter receptor subunit TctC